MMFCKSCGAQIEESDKFCTKCGAPITQALTAAQPAPKKPFNKKIIILIAVLSLLLIGITVGGIIVMNNIRHKQAQKLKTVNVNDFVELEISGYDGQGEAEVKFDYNDFYDAVMAAIGGSNASGSSKYRYKALTQDVCNSVRFTAVPKDGLSNGDTVTVEMDYSEEAAKNAGVILEFESYKETVKGLEEVTKVDIFEYLEFSLEGMSGNAWLLYENTATEKGLEEVRFSADKSYNLSVGDVITFTVDDYYVSRLSDRYGIVLESTSKTYTITKDDIDRYIESLSEISDELFEKMQQYAVEEIEDTYDWNWNMEISDIEYMGMYFMTSNDKSVYAGNCAFMIYTAKVTFEYSDIDETTVYLPVQVNDLIRRTDGSQECNSWVLLWDDGGYSGASAADGYLSERDMFLDIFNEENLMSFIYEISEGMRDFYDDPLEPEAPTEKETADEKETSDEGETADEKETSDEGETTDEKETSDEGETYPFWSF